MRDRTASAARSSATEPAATTANERLKARSNDIVAYSLIVATVAHFLVFQLWPEMTTDIWVDNAGQPVDVVRLDEVVLPVAPERLVRPQAPVVSETAPADATIEPLGFADVPDLPPPPPPPATDARSGERSAFDVTEVPPRLLNPNEVYEALYRAYPAPLRDAGIGGIVRLRIHVDAEGRPVEALVDEGSGYRQLDDIAVRLIDAMRFSPAMNRDRRVPVWVQIPIEFRIRR